MIKTPFFLIAFFIMWYAPYQILGQKNTSVAEQYFEQRADSTKFIPKPPKKTTSATATYAADEIVVTGSRNEMLLKNSPVRVEVAGKDRIRQTGMVTLGNLLQEQTGVTLVNNVRSGVQLNGLSPDYTLILIDGQPLVGRVAGVLDLNRVSVGNIERVEIVKGPMSSLYGSEALAGVINIITREPEDGLRLRGYGQYLQRGASEVQTEASYAMDDWQVSMYGNAKHSAPFTLSQDSITTPFSGFTDGTAQATAKWRISPSLSVGLNGRLFYSESRGAFIESFFGQVAANEGSVIQNDRAGTFSLDWRHGTAHVSLQSYYSKYSERYYFDVEQGEAGRVDDYHRTLSRTIMQYDLLWTEAHRFTFGGEFLYEDAQGSRYPDEPWYRTIVGFGQWEGTPTDWLAYSMSARFDGNSIFGNSFNPKFSLLLKPDSENRYQIRASVGTGFRAPDFRQLYVEFSNRLPGANYDLIGAARLGNTLEPERSTAFDLSLNAELGEFVLGGTSFGRWKADIRGFRNNLRNLIEFYYAGLVGQRAVYSYRNLSRVITQGVESNISSLFTLGEGAVLTFSAGYQYLSAVDSEVIEAIEQGKAGTTDQHTGEFIPLQRQDYGGLWFRSPHTANARMQVVLPEWGLSANIRAQYVGRFGDEALDKNGLVLGNPSRKVPDRADEYVNGYWNINAACSKQFSFNATNFTVTAGVNNILDVLNLQSLPGLVGRQLFINCGIEW